MSRSRKTDMYSKSSKFKELVHPRSSHARALDKSQILSKSVKSFKKTGC
jgi:hypothetical protein